MFKISKMFMWQKNCSHPALSWMPYSMSCWDWSWLNLVQKTQKWCWEKQPKAMAQIISALLTADMYLPFVTAGCSFRIQLEFPFPPGWSANSSNQDHFSSFMLGQWMWTFFSCRARILIFHGFLSSCLDFHSELSLRLHLKFIRNWSWCRMQQPILLSRVFCHKYITPVLHNCMDWLGCWMELKALVLICKACKWPGTSLPPSLVGNWD